MLYFVKQAAVCLALCTLVTMGYPTAHHRDSGMVEGLTTSMTQPWWMVTGSATTSWVTGEFANLNPQDQTVEYWKDLLGVRENGHPVLNAISEEVRSQLIEEESDQSNTPVPPLVVLTSNDQLRRDTYSLDTSITAYNLTDGDDSTSLTVLGTDSNTHQPWITVILSATTFVRGVELTLPPALNQTDLKISVQINWLTMIKDCDPSTYTSNHTVYITCGEHIADTIFIQIFKAWSLPPTSLTLSEVTVWGVPIVESRLATRSQLVEMTGPAILNAVSRKHSYRAPTYDFMLSGQFTASKVSKEGSIRVGKKGATLEIESCPIVNLDYSLVYSAACLSADGIPCSWTLVFLNYEIVVYFDSIMVGYSSWNLTESCSGDPSDSCSYCMKVLDYTKFITSRDVADWRLTSLKIDKFVHSLRHKNTKVDRHDYCYGAEGFLYKHCESQIGFDIYKNLDNGTFKYGYELLNLTPLLKEKFDYFYAKDFIDDLIPHIAPQIEDEFFASPEYDYIIHQSLYGDYFEMLILLEQAELEAQRELIEAEKMAFSNRILKHDCSDFFKILEKVIPVSFRIPSHTLDKDVDQDVDIEARESEEDEVKFFQWWAENVALNLETAEKELEQVFGSAALLVNREISTGSRPPPTLAPTPTPTSTTGNSTAGNSTRTVRFNARYGFINNFIDEHQDYTGPMFAG